MPKAAIRPDAESIRAASVRLRGHVVATPLIGGLLLPGFDHGADVRIKPELLQPSGSIWYRGLLHFVLRAMGRHARYAWAEGGGSALAAAAAASIARAPVCLFLSEPPVPGAAAALVHLGAQIERVDDPQAAVRDHGRSTGAMRFPGVEDADVAAGIATVGLELAAALPHDAAAVFVPEGLQEPVAAGLAAGEHRAVAIGVPPGAVDEALGTRLLEGHRLRAGPAALAALAAALRQPGGSVVAALLSD